MDHQSTIPLVIDPSNTILLQNVTSEIQ